MRVFISGPLTQGNQTRNVENAMRVGAALMDAGHAPFIPHLFSFMELHECAIGIGYEDWMRVDLEMIAGCEALLRIPGYSPGAVREVARAIELGIPVFYSLDDIPCASPSPV